MILKERKITHLKKDNDATQDSPEYWDPLYVIIFPSNAAKTTVHWLVDLLQQDQLHGGAELLTNTYTIENGEIVVEISANPIRLLEAAEAMEIVKEDKQGNKRDFVYSNIDLFLKPGVDKNNLLSTLEKQTIILNELMGLHAENKEELFGYPHIKLYPGQSMIQVCKDHDIIKQLFPLHEPRELMSLQKKWYTLPFSLRSLDHVRNYFGEAIGFYFAFLGFYTLALIPTSVVGLLQSVITLDVTYSYIFFAILKMIWLTLFLESWKRKSNELAFSWGTLKIVSLPELHPTFRGNSMGIDPVTKQYVPVYRGYKRHFKVYFISMPLLCLCLMFATMVMLVYFDVEDWAIELYQENDDILAWILIQIPGVIYAVLVYIMSIGFRSVATFLTEWENHRTQESYENYRICKMIIFDFVNNFVSLGYVAFYRQDMSLLKWQITIMMVVNQLINQFQEAILPLVLQRFSCVLKKKPKCEDEKESTRTIKESEMWPYEGTYDDYLEMLIQFGYVFLFSSVCPLASVFALINNVVEVWVDGFKLCQTYQRPKARPAKGIGVWQIAFEVLGILSVMTNSALICLSPTMQSYTAEISPFSWLLIAVAIEHVIITIKMALSYLIPDVPKWVTLEIQKARYESLQALKMKKKQPFKKMSESEDKKIL